MIAPTDPTTHSIVVGYHADIEMPEQGGHMLQPPQITAAEVEQEIIEDEWNSLVTGNGEYVPAHRMGRSRPPVAASGAGEDNR